MKWPVVLWSPQISSLAGSCKRVRACMLHSKPAESLPARYFTVAWLLTRYSINVPVLPQLVANHGVRASAQLGKQKQLRWQKASRLLAC